MKKILGLMLAGATLAVAVPASAQTASDTARLQSAQDRFNRELTNYRNTPVPYRARNNRNNNRYQLAQDRLDRELSSYRTELDRYQGILRDNRGYASNNGYNNNNSNYANNGNYSDDTYYDPTRDYRDGNYQERVVSTDERVYRGTDGRYYCKRQDGTTGLIVGGLAGGVLGNVIDGGRSRVLGTLLGGVAGALGGRAVERGVNDRNGNVTCR